MTASPPPTSPPALSGEIQQIVNEEEDWNYPPLSLSSSSQFDLGVQAVLTIRAVDNQLIQRHHPP